MGLLARAPSRRLLSLVQIGDLPISEDIRAPEIGLVMVRGRMGGSGAPFNLGEMPVTRCTIAVDGVVGHSMVQGRRPDHARMAAVIDALLQRPEWRDRLMNTVIESLETAEREAQTARREDVAATAVEFFTLVRGEDEK